MADAKTAADVLGALLLGGLMGMVGQGARTIVGLKKISDMSQSTPDQSDFFAASRIFIGLMIGFVAGIAAGIALKIYELTSFDASLLMGLVAAGYAGTDFIEGFVSSISTKPPMQPAGKPAAEDKGEVQKPAESQDAQKHAPAPEFARELIEAKKYQADVTAAGQKYGVATELIYGIGSRESAWGLTLRPPGPAGTGDWKARSGKMPPDDQGWGRGLMQIDYAAHPFAQTGDWKDPAENIDYACEFLASEVKFFANNNDPGVDPTRAGIAAYNCGRGNVVKAIQERRDVDYYTTGHNYSEDVIRRATWFKTHI
jgi:Transglycosylase SLT domain